MSEALPVIPAAPPAPQPAPHVIIQQAAPEHIDPDDVSADSPPPKGWEDRPGAWKTFKKATIAAREAKADAAAARAEAAAAKAEAESAKGQIESSRARYEFDAAMMGIGIADADDAAEFAARYERLQPGEDGKKPTAREWAKAIKEAPPKWARGYFAAEVDDEPAEPRPGLTTVRQQTPPAARPNGGVRADNGRAPAVYSNAAVARMTPAEVLANKNAIMAQAIADGEIKAPKGWKPPA
jgi:hypothetical protein